MAEAYIAFDTRAPKKNHADAKDPLYPIIIRISHKRDTKQIKTGYSCTVSQWDAGSLSIKKSISFGDYQEANAIISDLKAKAQNYIIKNKGKIWSMTCKQLRDEIQKYHPDQEEQPTERILTLKEAIQIYTDYLHNKNVPEHIQRQRSKEYLAAVDKCLKKLTVAIGEDKLINDVGEKEAGKYFAVVSNILTKTGEKIKPPTYNFYIGAVRHLFTFLNEKGYQCKNPFLEIKFRKSETPPVMALLEEFYALLDKIETGNHIKVVKYKTKTGAIQSENRNMYHPWLKGAIMLSLYGGGRRREEIVMLKWPHIIPGKVALLGGVVSYRNLKSERGKNAIFKEETALVEIPITPQLSDLLILLGWKSKMGLDEYIIAPEATNRIHLMHTISRCFAHYYAQIPNPRPGISFKSLRKTYITYVSAILAGRAKEITGHSSDKIIQDHYQDQTLIRERIVKELDFEKK